MVIYGPPVLWLFCFGGYGLGIIVFLILGSYMKCDLNLVLKILLDLLEGPTRRAKKYVRAIFWLRLN